MFSLEDGNEMRLMLWDTAGQEEFDAITKAYYRGWCRAICGKRLLLAPAAHVLLIDYDWTAPVSFAVGLCYPRCFVKTTNVSDSAGTCFKVVNAVCNKNG